MAKGKEEEILRQTLCVWAEASACAQSLREQTARLASLMARVPPAALQAMYGKHAERIRQGVAGLAYMALVMEDEYDFGGVCFMFQTEAAELFDCSLNAQQRAEVRAAIDAAMDSRQERERMERRTAEEGD